jgi:hypothetical protein
MRNTHSRRPDPERSEGEGSAFPAFSRQFAALVLASGIVSMPLGAQAVHRPANGRAAAAGAGARVAGIAPPPPVIIAPQFNNGVYVPPGMVLYGNLPIVVMPDGRVYADFGRGYEQVIRSCSSVVTYSVIQPTVPTQPIVTQPVVTQPGVAPLPYTPPVPNQQPPSQQMLGQPPQFVSGHAMQPLNFGSQSCWTTNGHRVFIARP